MSDGVHRRPYMAALAVATIIVLTNTVAGWVTPDHGPSAPALSTPRAGAEVTSTTTPRVTVRRITSTAYCLRGRMANGRTVHRGAVASHTLPRGSAWVVTSGPLAGRRFTVEDTGPGATFDVWMSTCHAARLYGRRTITITEDHDIKE